MWEEYVSVGTITRGQSVYWHLTGSAGSAEGKECSVS